jgi:peptidyl-prolyl cis-trans isomerase SurA
MQHTLNKFPLYSFLFITSLCCSHSISAFAAPSNNQSFDGIAAVVNNSIITKSEVAHHKLVLQEALQHAGKPVPSEQQLTKQVLQNLIDMKLILQQAKEQKITTTEEQVDQAIQNIAAQNNIPISQLKQVISKQGFSWLSYRQQIREQMIANAVENQELGNKIKVSNEEISNFLATQGKELKSTTEYHLEGILVPVSQNPTTNDLLQTQQLALTLIPQLKGAVDINVLAKSQMTADGQPLQAGDLGWRSLSSLPPQFSSNLANTKLGTVVGPLPSPVGYYVFKVAGVRSMPVQHFTEAYHVRHILIKHNSLTNSLTTTDTAKTRLEKIRTDLQNGADFAKLAAVYSQDPGNANKGGDMGWITPSMLSPGSAAIITQLKPGQISQPFQTTEGWELIQVLASKKTNDTQSFLDNEGQMAVYQQKFEPALQAWLKQLQQKAYIKIYEG